MGFTNKHLRKISRQVCDVRNICYWCKAVLNIKRLRVFKGKWICNACWKKHQGTATIEGYKP